MVLPLLLLGQVWPVLAVSNVLHLQLRLNLQLKTHSKIN